jgi:quercetin dioxygenase-like cupin family protein
MDDLEYESDAYYTDAEMVDSDEFEWGARKTLVSGARIPGAEMTFTQVWILPGQEDPLHQHPNAEMVGHVLAGECEFQVGDALFHLEAGDTIRVPRGVPHQATCTGWEPLRMIVAQSAASIETVPVVE